MLARSLAVLWHRNGLEVLGVWLHDNDEWKLTESTDATVASVESDTHPLRENQMMYYKRLQDGQVQGMGNTPN
jgi:hypothetical protein